MIDRLLYSCFCCFSIWLCMPSVSFGPVGVFSEIHFHYYTDVCLNQTVSYQCSVTGSGLLALTWRVTTNETQFGFPISYSNNYYQNPYEIGGVFRAKQISLSPLISNISFTVQSSFNGYTISCEDLFSSSNDSMIIKIDPLDPPDNVAIHTDTFTNSSVNISWTESSSPCVTGYRYNISSSALEENIIKESTSNSVMVEGLVPSDDQYCVVVTAINQYYSPSHSNPKCFFSKVPTVRLNVSVSYKTVTYSDIEIKVCVLWMKNNVNEGYVPVPDIIGYKVILHDNNSSCSSQSGLLPLNVTQYFFQVENGGNYSVTVIIINGIGSNSTTVPIIISNAIAHKPLDIVESTQSKSKAMIPSTSLIESKSLAITSSKAPFDYTIGFNSFSNFPPPSAIPNNCPSCSCAVTIVAGISVAITVPVTAVITAIITVIILYCCCGFMKRVSPDKATPTSVLNVNELNIMNNTAYGQLTTINKTDATNVIYDHVK